MKDRQRRTKPLSICGWIVTVSLITILGFIAFLSALIFYYLPGYGNSYQSRSWTIAGIEYFLARSFPASAQDINYQGRTGIGINPHDLDFSFRASPDDATAFAYSFCNGVLHQGYDPLNAVDSASPSQDSVLIADGGFLYYSTSSDAGGNVSGNRCERLDDRDKNVFGDPITWFEEISLALSESLATVRYRLPYDANSTNPPASYPVAHHINLFGPDLLNPYDQAEITFLIDDTLLFTTTLNERSVMVEQEPAEFCFDTTWGAGLHTARLDVQRADGVRETFDWQFFTPDEIAGL